MSVTKKEINSYLSRCNEALRDIRTLMSQQKQFFATADGPSEFRAELRVQILELTGCAGEVEQLLNEYYDLSFELGGH